MATIKDVAKHAGVSFTTVSYFLNNKKKLKDETREKILAAIRETGYRYNPAAGALKRGRGSMQKVGIISIVEENPFFADLFFELEKQCFLEGFTVLSCFRHKNDSELVEHINLMSNQVDAIVLITIGSDLIETILKTIHSTPIVPISLEPTSVNTMCGGTTLDINNHTGGYIAGKFFCLKGHKRFACLSGPKGLNTSIHRNEGFKKALSEAGFSENDVTILHGDFTHTSGAEMMSKLFSIPSLPTAIFCHNDLIAIGALNAAHEMGLKVPDDISIIGYDNILPSELSFPSLTTVNIPLDELASQTLTALKEKHLNRNYHAKISVMPNLVIRKSVSAR